MKRMQQPRTVTVDISKLPEGKTAPKTQRIVCLACRGTGKRRARVIIYDPLLPVLDAHVQPSLYDIPADHWPLPIQQHGVAKGSTSIKELNDFKLRAAINKLVYSARKSLGLREQLINALLAVPQFPFLIAEAHLRRLDGYPDWCREALRGLPDVLSSSAKWRDAAISACEEALTVVAVSDQLEGGSNYMEAGF